MPYTLDDLETMLAALTDNAAFAEQFFDDHIYGSAMVDLKPLLAHAGFLLEQENPGAAVMQTGSTNIDFEADEPTISANTTVGSPLYKAGVDRGDIVLSIGGQEISNARDLQRLLAAHSPGDSLSITYRSLDEKYESTLVLAEDPTLQMVPYEQVGKELTSEMKSFRESWLGSKAEK
jgi:predicted metalloprotease with PDZ domain